MFRMQGTISRWRRFPAAERRFLLRAWLWLLLFDLALRALPFRIAQRLASHRSKRVRPSPLRPRRMAQLVAAAGRNHLHPMTCLRQTLTLQRLLGRQGVASTLRIGVRKSDGAVQAHAWLEVDGEVLEASPEASAFAALRPSRGS